MSGRSAPSTGTSPSTVAVADAAGVAPAPADEEAALDRHRSAGWERGTGRDHVRLRPEDLVLGVLREQRQDQVVLHEERRHPCGGRVGLAEWQDDLDEVDDAELQPAVAAGDEVAEHTAGVDGGEHLVVEAALLLGISRPRRHQWLQCHHAVDQVGRGQRPIRRHRRHRSGVRSWAGDGRGGPLGAGDAAMARADEAFGRFDVDAMVAHLSAAMRKLTERETAGRRSRRPARRHLSPTSSATCRGAGVVRPRRRLVADEPPCIEQGWVAVAGMGCDVDDPDDCWPAPSWPSTEPGASATSSWRPRRSPTAGLPTCRPDGSPRGWHARRGDGAGVRPCRRRRRASKSVCSFFTACYHAADSTGPELGVEICGGAA